jgi:hypothetical protein
MKKVVIFVILILSAVGYQVWHIRASRARPWSNGSHIVVYGRESCSITRDFMSGLDSSGAGYVFKNVDDRSVLEELFARMKNAGLDTTSFSLPVVDVNGRMFIRPELNRVLELCQKPVRVTQSAPSKNNKTCSVKISPPLKTNAALKGPLEISGITLGEQPMAIVGDEVVKVGDKVGVYEVQEIQQDSVKLRDADGKIIIKQMNQD